MSEQKNPDHILVSLTEHLSALRQMLGEPEQRLLDRLVMNTEFDVDVEAHIITVADPRLTSGADSITLADMAKEEDELLAGADVVSHAMATTAGQGRQQERYGILLAEAGAYMLKNVTAGGEAAVTTGGDMF